MQVDDRVSIKTWYFREDGAAAYVSQVVRFGASDAVALEAIHYNIEGASIASVLFGGMALSKNPSHLAAPPAEIAAWWWDESLYARATWNYSFLGGSTDLGHGLVSTIIVPMYGIIVPSRQIAVHMHIGSGSYGFHAECYFREAKVSRAEADLLNITWGKYRR